MEQPISINLNISLSELPKCPCGEGFLLPIEDVEGTVPYLKGWLCRSCNTAVTFKKGYIALESINPSLTR